MRGFLVKGHSSIRMFRHPLFVTIACTILLIAVLHAAALSSYWYWVYPWLDTGMHFLGGAWTAWTVLWVAGVMCAFPVSSWTTRDVLLAGVLAALSIGLFWEVFEVYAGVFPYLEERFPDTYYDIVADVVGGYAGALDVRERFFRKM